MEMMKFRDARRHSGLASFAPRKPQDLHRLRSVLGTRDSRVWFLLVVFALSSGVYAGEECFRGCADSGELSFSGVMEGAPFRGEFGEFSVRYCAGGQIEVTVATESASVGNRDGDRAMAGEEFFCPESWPEATWIGDAAESDGVSREVPGTLTIRGIGREVPVTLAVEQNGDNLRIHGETKVARLDFDVGTGEFEDTSFIANEVRVRFNIELAPVHK